MKAEREKADAEAILKAEEDRKRQELERAQADMENIQRVHWAIIPAMVGVGITDDQAKALILAIRNSEIPAVSINYQWRGLAESEAAGQ